ncbi:MAG: thiol:disulfide interchange protein DsbA/DsbL [Nevskia sp.]|nr:thiol:disulfide interchange protein DsbA/DsbL [Nevskia sp.]
MLKRLICCVVLLAWSGIASAQGPLKWVEGTHYVRLDSPQPTSTPGKVEVLDVFSYACPACNAFQPTLDKLVRALPPTAQMAYLPASFNPQEDWPVFQRAFLAAQNLGVAEKSHDAMYDAVWGKRTLAIVDKASGHLIPQAQQPKIEDVAKFYTAYGVKEDQFLAVAKSFTIDTQMRAADASLLAHQVMSTPTLIVNGKYRVTPQTAGGWDQTVELVLYLVDKEKSGK